MQLTTVSIEKPLEINFILGQSHFIKTVEDIHEALVGTVPGIKFGLAFCEASGKCLVRTSGTDEEMIALAEKNALAIAAGRRSANREALPASSCPCSTVWNLSMKDNGPVICEQSIRTARRLSFGIACSIRSTMRLASRRSNSPRYVASM